MNHKQLLRELSYAVVWAFDGPPEVQETLKLPKSWYRLAVLAMFRDLTDRRSIKHPLQEMDPDVRRLVVSTLTARLRLVCTYDEETVNSSIPNTKWAELVINLLTGLNDLSPGFAVELENIDADVYSEELIPELAVLIKGAFLNWPMDWGLALDEHKRMHNAHQKYLAKFPILGNT